MANENVGVYDPGRDLTVHCQSAVTGKRFLAIAADRITSDSSNNIVVTTATAAGRTCGVSKYDAPAGGKCGMYRGNSRVVFVTASAALTAFQEVEVGITGQAAPKNAGVAVGFAVTSCASGADAEISLY